TVSQVIHDFTIVWEFMIRNKYISFIYLGSIIIMIFSFAMDAQEVVFIQRVIGLTETDYSFLISITGVGSITGAILLTIFSKWLSLRYLLSNGLFMVTVGYMIYAFSWFFMSVSVGFIILGVFNAFLSAGSLSFFQFNFPLIDIDRSH